MSVDPSYTLLSFSKAQLKQSINNTKRVRESLADSIMELMNQSDVTKDQVLSVLDNNLPGVSPVSSENSRAAKKARKADRPKQVPSAYLIFCNSIRAKTAANNPDADAKKIMQLNGEEWKNLTEEEKQPYRDQHNELKLKQLSGESAPEVVEKTPTTKAAVEKASTPAAKEAVKKAAPTKKEVAPAPAVVAPAPATVVAAKKVAAVAKK
jgi:hypothetical protein